MLEATFCKGVADVSLCYWAWRFVLAIAFIFVGWKLLMPKRKNR